MSFCHAISAVRVERVKRAQWTSADIMVLQCQHLITGQIGDTRNWLGQRPIIGKAFVRQRAYLKTYWGIVWMSWKCPNSNIRLMMMMMMGMMIEIIKKQL